MPKLVREIASGSENSRSLENSQTADVSVRTFRVILDSASEAYDVQEAVGVYIGDVHPVNSNLPCVSISEKAEGDSRVVRIVTVNYRTSPGADPGSDPNKQPPDIRPAQFAISSSLMEVPAVKWRKILDNGNVGGLPLAPVNPAGDRYDGVTMLVPILSINIEQFDNSPTSRLDDAGKINGDDINFLGLPIPRYTCMLRNIGVQPVVETFGSATYRGFKRTYEFAVKKQGGWYIDQILEGFNIINDGLGDAGVDRKALNLEHEEYVVKNWPDGPLELAEGTEGDKMRAMVLVSSPNKKAMQRPSAQPVALNRDGTPRDVENPPNGEEAVLTDRYITQETVDFGNNFVNMGVRIQDII
jgi:hypothetical protein